MYREKVLRVTADALWRQHERHNDDDNDDDGCFIMTSLFYNCPIGVQLSPKYLKFSRV